MGRRRMRGALTALAASTLVALTAGIVAPMEASAAAVSPPGIPIILFGGPLTISPSGTPPLELPYAYMGQPYSTQLSASGGFGPYNFSVTAGVLPAGLTLSSNGLISGAATVDQDQTFTVRVTDIFGDPPASQQYIIEVGYTATLTTSASPDVSLGGSIFDTATVTRVAGPYSPFGTVTFNAYGPDDATCTNRPVFTSTVNVDGDGSYPSGQFRPQSAGKYRWSASYSNDVHNSAPPSGCNASGESQVVSGSQPVYYPPPPPGTTTSLFSTPNPSNLGDPVTFSANVASSSSGTPTGTVTFQEGSTTLGSATLSGQSAMLTLNTLPVGSHDVTATYAGDGTFAGSTSNHDIQTVVQPPPPPPVTSPRPSCLPGNQVMVCAAYQDILARYPDQGALDGWFARIDSHELTRTQVVGAITSSTEYQTDLVTSMYTTYLRRSPDSAGLAFLVGLLKGGVSDEAIRAGMLGSGEFYSLAGSTPAGYVSSLYTAVLGRPVDPAGLATAQAELASGRSRAQVAAAILGSPEYRRLLVGNWYEEFLRRPADPAGMGEYAGALAAGVTDEQVIDILVGSDEYYALAQSR